MFVLVRQSFMTKKLNWSAFYELYALVVIIKSYLIRISVLIGLRC